MTDNQQRNALVTAAGLVAGASLAYLAASRSGRKESFRDQVVLITGASRGLGLVLARRFAAEGARVAIVGRDQVSLIEAKEDLLEYGGEVDAFPCDITKREEAERAITRLISRWGRIDVLVNNAGTIISAPFQHTSIENFEEALGVFFWGPLYLIRAAYPHMRRQRGGRIVNIASIGGKVAVPHLLAYCSGKFALTGLSTGLHSELARDRIAVTTVSPGLMRTGSHINARFKGRHKAEYAWFALADALPLTSIDVERAARQIVEATRRKRAELIITSQAKLLAAATALAPELMAAVLSLTNSLLPKPVGAQGNVEHRGSESKPRWMPKLVTRLADRAAEANNEIRLHPAPNQGRA
jgi:short-subunit dehydrogenase